MGQPLKDDRTYGWDGTSNRVPTEILDNAAFLPSHRAQSVLVRFHR
jgi:hypothetical protein